MASLALVSGCKRTPKRPPQTYSANGVTFQYPAGWVVIPPDRMAVVVTDSKLLAVVADQPEKNRAMVSVRKVVTSKSLAEYTQSIRSASESGGRKLMSHRSFQVAGFPATEMIKRMSRLSGQPVIERYVLFGKDGEIYSITCTADLGHHEALKPSFDQIVSSLKVR